MSPTRGRVYGIFSPEVRERKLGIAVFGVFGVKILAAQELFFSRLSARGAEKGIAYRIEYRCLSRAGIAAYQKKTVSPGKIDRMHPRLVRIVGERPEIAHFKHDRSH